LIGIWKIPRPWREGQLRG